MAAEIDWHRIVRLTLTSRAIDAIEEQRLLPERKVLYQFSARGHDMSQIILGALLDHRHDAASAYYRSRPLLLTLGLSVADAFAGPLMRSGGFSDGRDIGVVCNLPRESGPIVLPMSGDVGSQYTPAAGWAQSLLYRARVLKEQACQGSISVVLGGEASVATNGFWSALTIATTLKLPLLFYVEDNGYGISVPSAFQTPGGNIAKNLGAFQNLKIFDGDGTEPQQSSALLTAAVSYVREWKGPALVRLTVPRLSGHSGQDTQAYKSPLTLESESAMDPLPKLKSFVLTQGLSPSEWAKIEKEVEQAVAAGLEEALARPQPDSSRIKRYVFSETWEDGSPELAACGGVRRAGFFAQAGTLAPVSEPTRINMVTAIRRTLEHELKTNPRMLVFGEDVGPKGGVHAATLGLQEAFGEQRVFDTSLSEEGIVGRAVGMAIAGLLPVAEIQFRKYADPATEQLHNCGTMRWRTNNRFAAPIVVRMPGGYFKCGDPWHSVSDEVIWAHAIGWQVVMPSNAEDAVGLLRSALRSDNPTIFFEHRAMLDHAWSRRPYPGDEYVVPLGKAKIVRPGSALSCITWGAMVERCEAAAEEFGEQVEVLDLRSISPWDRETVLASVKKTRRCLIVHEDGITAGFGAEIAAVLAQESFFNLDAPVERLAVEDLPIPHNLALMEQVVPSVEKIMQRLAAILEL
ncbi:MAG: pyruvate dehydrogenase [Oligoflexia bacterium]|nr:pyruvate dehydrogenase [Oligoflexia bacterium]